MPTIIAILISIGLLTTAADWDNLSSQEQDEMIEIVETDIVY